MKKSIFTVLSAAALTAASVGYANATPSTCANQDVTTSLVCTLGGLTFTFEEVKFTGTGSASDLLDLSTPPTAATPGLALLGFTVLATYPADIELVYKVSSPTANITQIASSFGPPQPSGSSIFESACANDPTVIPPGCGVPPLATVTNTTGAYTVSPTFGPVSTIYVDKDITDGGFSTFTDAVYDPAVPEPMTLSLLGGGLAVLGMLRFRTKKS
jgi:hypothetical protein